MPANHHLPRKPCKTCGRDIVWRKKWERSWEQVLYCSDACRRPATADDTNLETAILKLLQSRPRGATICPSEAARQVFPDSWRLRMEDARRAARRLVAQGRVEVTQKGRAVDPSSARGPIRIRLIVRGD